MLWLGRTVDSTTIVVAVATPPTESSPGRVTIDERAVGEAARAAGMRAGVVVQVHTGYSRPVVRGEVERGVDLIMLSARRSSFSAAKSQSVEADSTGVSPGRADVVLARAVRDNAFVRVESVAPVGRGHSVGCDLRSQMRGRMGKSMGLRKKSLLMAVSVLSMTVPAVRQADAVGICPLTTGEVVAVLTAPTTGVTCSFNIVRMGVQAVTLTMQSATFATARVRLNGATCAVVTGVGGAATSFCPTWGAFGTLELTMSSSAISAQATLLNVPLP